MIGLGSVVGFAIVFLLVAVATSALACAAIALAGPALAARGAAVEKRAVELAAIAPVVIAGVVVTALIAHSAIAVDHCGVHDHHAHLCVAHGDAWLTRPWAVAVGAAALVVVLGRALLLAASLVRTRARVAALRRHARAIDDVLVVESPRAFAFVAGVRRPAIFASTAVWHGLADDERAAVLAHERGHVRGGDVGRRVVLELATIATAPGVPGFLAARWHDANERLRDHGAAAVTSSEAVARALVRMCRLGAVHVAGMSFEAGAASLERRVHGVLDDAPVGGAAARTLAIAAIVVASALACAAIVYVDPLHHALETLLG